MKRHQILIAAAVVALGLTLFGVWKIATTLEAGAYKAPVASSASAPDGDTPRDRKVVELDAQRQAELEELKYEPKEYRTPPFGTSREWVWVLAQLHLLFAAFVLAVPIFAVTIEVIGYVTKDSRYDKLAYEFTKLLSVSFSLTATFGAFLAFMLLALYPGFMDKFAAGFSPTFIPYVGLFFLEAAFLYSYYYGWGKFHPIVHIGLGVGLNVVGTAIMFIANGWLTFQMSPAGVSSDGVVYDLMAAMTNFTWMPVNIHRVIANVAFGGSIAGAYAAWKYLQSKTPEERAHYDWMGYIGMFVAVSAFLPLPFAGYWLAREIYGFNQALGIMMMGGAFSWLFIIQAALIGNLFLGANFYLWLGMGRVEGTRQFQKTIKWLLIAVAVCFAVWATPRNLVATSSEVRDMGGSAHPSVGVLGYMSAKNTAVNILILTTYVSFLLYRRSGKRPVVSWAKSGTAIQFGVFFAVSAYVIWLGIYGYMVDAATRIGFSIYQVIAVLIAMVAMTVIDVPMMRGAEKLGVMRWGKMPAVSQYVLIFISITFTWLMGLMGYVRSGLRQHWHVFGVIRDNSPDAFTPTLGYATKMVSLIVLIFFAFIALVFWLAGLSHKKTWQPKAEKEGGPLPSGAAGAEPTLGGGAIARSYEDKP